jgi:hypothetical protein
LIFLSQIIFLSPKSGKIIFLCENLNQKYFKKKIEKTPNIRPLTDCRAKIVRFSLSIVFIK